MCNSPFAIRRPPARMAFTLVELLVVIAIIGLLASLTVGAVVTVRASQEKRFTETTISKLATALDLQWKAVIDQSRDENLTPGVLALASGDLRRARVINIKLKLKQSLPNSFADALIPNLDLTPAANFVQVLSGGTSTASPPSTVNGFPVADWQSSALLYLALNRASRGMAAFNSDDAIDANFVRTVTLPIENPPGSNKYSLKDFKCYVDVWGTPLRVYTFPYYCDELNAPPYVNASLPTNQRDPQDPEGTLVDPKWDLTTSSNAKTFASGGSLGGLVLPAVHPLPFFDGTSPTTAPFTARYLIPVIVSAGKDQDFGGTYDRFFLNLSQGKAGPGADDNILSYRLRQFGQRGDR